MRLLVGWTLSYTHYYILMHLILAYLPESWVHDISAIIIAISLEEDSEALRSDMCY